MRFHCPGAPGMWSPARAAARVNPARRWGRGESPLGVGVRQHQHQGLSPSWSWCLVVQPSVARAPPWGRAPHSQDVNHLPFHPDSQDERKSYLDVFLWQKDYWKLHCLGMYLVGEDSIIFLLRRIFLLPGIFLCSVLKLQNWEWQNMQKWIIGESNSSEMIKWAVGGMPFKTEHEQ